LPFFDQPCVPCGGKRLLVLRQTHLLARLDEAMTAIFRVRSQTEPCRDGGHNEWALSHAPDMVMVLAAGRWNNLLQPLWYAMGSGRTGPYGQADGSFDQAGLPVAADHRLGHPAAWIAPPTPQHQYSSDLWLRLPVGLGPMASCTPVGMWSSKGIGEGTAHPLP